LKYGEKIFNSHEFLYQTISGNEITTNGMDHPSRYFSV